MVRASFVDKNGMKKGAWSEEEDNKLRAYLLRYGHWNWRQLPKFAGLSRCGKSCRLRWVNYLRPGIKRGNFTKDEDELVLKLHKELGNKWSAIAAKLPGRSDHEIKNHWHTRLKKFDLGFIESKAQCKKTTQTQSRADDQSVWPSEKSQVIQVQQLATVDHNATSDDPNYDLQTAEETLRFSPGTEPFSSFLDSTFLSGEEGTSNDAATSFQEPFDRSLWNDNKEWEQECFLPDSLFSDEEIEFLLKKFP